MDAVPLIGVPLSGSFSVGPFEIELITLTHSIPEPNAVVIRTAAGTVLHTADWTLDPTPLVGEAYDEPRLKALAHERSEERRGGKACVDTCRPRGYPSLIKQKKQKK